MKSFPDAEAYLVTYFAGAFGGIITTLITSLVTDDKDLEGVEIAPSKNGNSHYGFALAQETWSPMSRVLIDRLRWNTSKEDGRASFRAIMQHPNLSVNQWEMAEPKNNVIVMYDHVPVASHKMLGNIFPKFKQIITSWKAGDKQHMEYNIFRKLICDEWEYSVVEQHHWERMRQRMLTEHPEESRGWLENYDDARDLLENTSDLRKFCNLYWPRPKEYDDSAPIGSTLWIDSGHFNEGYLSQKAGEYKDRLFYIQFNDVIHNPEKVLEQLSSLTNRPIKPITRQMYTAWLERQNLLDDMRD